jgi:hypothetical protein
MPPQLTSNAASARPRLTSPMRRLARPALPSIQLATEILSSREPAQPVFRSFARAMLSRIVQAMARAFHRGVWRLGRSFEMLEHHRSQRPQRRVTL